MKHILRFTIIAGISFLGEFLASIIPLPIPGSIYGLVLMLAGLSFGLIPLESVRTPGKFLIGIMPVMFIPAAVGLLDSWDVLRPVLFPVAVIMVLSTFVVMGVSARATQAVIRRKGSERSAEK